jgi:hypothetical protein
LASAVVLFLIFFAARALWRPNAIPQPVESAGNPIVPPLPTAPPQNHGPAVEPPVEKDEVSNPQLAISKSHAVREMLVIAKPTPEVLVPHDQELLLAEYAEQWSLHKRPLLLAQEFDATVLSPLQVAPIQIDELGVKLLAEEKLP